MPTSPYTFVAWDILTQTVKDEIPFSNVKYSVELSAPGSFSGVVHTNPTPYQLLSNAVVPNRITEANLDLCRTAIWVLKNGVALWGGILTAFDANLGNQQVTFAGQDFWGYWRRRVITQTQTFTNIDQHTIANNLISWGQGVGSFPGTYAGNPATSGVLRSRTYNFYETKTIGESIEQMAAMDRGFDFGIDYSGGPSNLGFKVTWSFPQRGRQTGLVFDASKDVQLMRWTKDGSRIANRTVAIGNGNGDATLAVVTSDTSLLSAYPVYETVNMHKDATDLTALTDHARQDLKYFKKPVETIELKVAANNVDVGLGTFIVGDVVTVKASSGFVQINNLYRIIGYTVEVDQDGFDIVLVRLAGLEATT